MSFRINTDVWLISLNCLNASGKQYGGPKTKRKPAGTDRIQAELLNEGGPAWYQAPREHLPDMEKEDVAQDWSDGIILFLIRRKVICRTATTGGE